MKRLTAPVILLITLCAAPIFCQTATPPNGAQQAAPYSIKGERLGETLAEWKSRNSPAQCDNDTIDGMAGTPVDPDVIFCLPSGNRTLANEELLSETAWFHREHLFKIEMTLYNILRLPPVMTALGEKFGEPTRHEVREGHNAFGATFEFHTWEWANGISTVKLTYRLTGSLNECPHVEVKLDSVDNEILDRREKAKVSKARSDI